MIAHKHRHVVGGGIPARLAGHLVVDWLSVDFHSFEGDVADAVVGVVAVDDGEIRRSARVADVAEGDILHAPTWCRAILLVISHLHLRNAASLNLFNANVIEEYIAHEVAVAAVNGQTALVVHLWLCLSQNVDVLINQMLDGVAHLRVAVNADEDRVRHVGPECAVAHPHISGVAAEALPSGVGRGAVIAVTAEHAVEKDIRGGKDI